jgi:cytochrome b561
MKSKSDDRSVILAWILHWATAGLVLLAFAMPFAQFFSQQWKKPIHFWHELHISVGTLAAALVLVRLILTWIRHRRSPRNAMANSAEILQVALLAMIVAISVLGLLAFGQPVLGAKMKFLGLWVFPDLRSLFSLRGSSFKELHWLLSYGFLALVAIHIWVGIRRGPRRNPRLIWKKLWPF